jgi:hypothetical protein
VCEIGQFGSLDRLSTLYVDSTTVLEVFLKLQTGSVDASVKDQFAARLPFPTLCPECLRDTMNKPQKLQIFEHRNARTIIFLLIYSDECEGTDRTSIPTMYRQSIHQIIISRVAGQHDKLSKFRSSGVKDVCTIK